MPLVQGRTSIYLYLKKSQVKINLIFLTCLLVNVSNNKVGWQKFANTLNRVCASNSKGAEVI